jgi:hypothetical protein
MVMVMFVMFVFLFALDSGCIVTDMLVRIFK